MLEATPNRAFRQPDGGLCLVLAQSEIILLVQSARATASGSPRCKSDWRIEDEERTYPMPRRDSHAWLAVTGRQAPAMFAKLCAIDLRLDRFPDLAIAQTSIAKMSAIVTRADIGATPDLSLACGQRGRLVLLRLSHATRPRSSAARSWASRHCKS